MKRAGHILFILLQCLVFSATAQDKDENQELVRRIMERLIENTESTADNLDLYDQLTYYLNNPLDINRATREELAALPMINAAQISAIIEHRNKYGNFIDLYELQSVPGLDMETLSLLRYFITIGNESAQTHIIKLKEALKNGRNDLIALTQRDVPASKGIANGTYPGSPYRALLRYRYTFGNTYSIGLTAEKDEGEQFFSGANKQGFDFYSFHALFRNIGRFKTIALGDYQVLFGQGLTIGTGLAFGKSAYVMNFRKNVTGFRPYRALNENEFMRGAATTVKVKDWEFSAFASHQKVDAGILQGDTNDVYNEGFSSLVLSGLHRTQSETDKKDAIGRSVFGGNISLKKKNWNMGFTAVNTHFSTAYMPQDKPYNLFAFAGNSVTNVGLDYSAVFRNINFFGETSKSLDGGFATLNGAVMSLHPKLDIGLLYRNYSRDYHAVLTNAFGETTRNYNENGLYLSAVLKSATNWIVNAYLDMYRFPWLSYNVDGPLAGNDALVEVQYNMSRRTRMYWRFRSESKQRNAVANETPLNYLAGQRRSIFRYHIDYKINERLSLKNRAEYVYFQADNTKPEQGLLIFQDIAYKPTNGRLSLMARLALFRTDGYNSRIYAYENDVLYVFSVPAYQNSGFRYYAIINYSVSKRLELWLRWAQTVYENLNVIGSGNDQIAGNKKGELKLQVRWNF